MDILRHAARNLRRSPGFVIMVIAILGIGVALNTAIFTVVDSVLLRPLSFRDADRIVALKTRFNNKNRTIDRLGGDDYNDIASQVSGLEAAAWYQSGKNGVQVDGRSVYLNDAVVSPRFGEVMGVLPLAGRLFRSEANEGEEALVSAEFAREQFGSAPAALNHTIRTQEKLRTIVGVLPDGFSFPGRSAIWLEGDARPRTASRTSYSQRVVAKRRADVSAAQLNAQLAVLSGQLQAAYADDRLKSLESIPLQDNIVGSVRPLLRLLMGSVLILLLIVCANVTHLQLVRATRQARLITIQSALGASRKRLAGQALAEALLLGLGGCIAALVIAVPAVRLLVHFAPPDVPRLEDVHLNSTVLLFSLAVSMLLMCLTAVLPVWRSWRLQPATALRQDTSRGLEGAGVRKLRSSFLVAQIALTLTLSVAATLLARQLIQESRQDFGFNAQNLITLDTHVVETVPAAALMHTVTPEEKAEQERQRRAVEVQRLAKLNATLEELRALPGIESAEAIAGAPMGFGGSDVGYAIRGRSVFAPPYKDLPNADLRPITPNLLASMHVPLLEGRWFSSSDQQQTPHVLLINQALAQQQFQGEDAVGKQIMCGYDEVETWWTIVGVVGNTRDKPGAEPVPMFYVPVAQHGDVAAEMQLVVRTSDASVTPALLVQHLRQSHPEFAVQGSTMAQNIGNVQRAEVFHSLLFSSFAAVSILLSAFGMYGLMAYSVAQRNFEFGLRFALGAQRSEVLGMVLRGGFSLTVAGLVLGVVLSLSLTRVLSSVVGKQPAFDAVAYLFAGGAVLLLTMLASVVPANRASRVNPNDVLRGEA